jgi:hypothetical protein
LSRQWREGCQPGASPRVSRPRIPPALKGRKESLRPFRAHNNRRISKPRALPWACIRRRFQRLRMWIWLSLGGFTLYIFLIQDAPEFRRDGRYRLVFVAVARRATFRRGLKPEEAGVVGARLSGGIDSIETRSDDSAGLRRSASSPAECHGCFPTRAQGCQHLGLGLRWPNQ